MRRITVASHTPFASVVLVVAFALLMCWCCLIDSAEVANLISNPSFESLRKGEAAKPQPEDWRFFVITMPAEGYCDTSKAASGKHSFKFSLGEKGMAFLHSRHFSVEPKAAYKVRLLSHGRGVISVEMLWWQSYPTPIVQAKRHRDALKEAVKLTDEKWQLIEAEFVAPEDAKQAYLRIVASNGDVWVDDVEVKPLP